MEIDKPTKNRSFSEDYISSSEGENENNVTFFCYNKKTKTMDHHTFSKKEFLYHAHQFTSKYHITCPTCGQSVENQYVRNGIWIVYSNEHILEKCTYIDGKLDGLYEYYHINKVPYEKTNYKNGVLHGSCEFWYDVTAKKMKSMNYVNGKLDGSYKYWSQDGKLAEDYVYKNGIRQDIIIKIPSKEEPKVPKDKTIFNVNNDVSNDVSNSLEVKSNLIQEVDVNEVSSIFDLDKKKKKSKKEKKEKKEKKNNEDSNSDFE
jgi:hypothetical protein